MTHKVGYLVKLLLSPTFVAIVSSLLGDGLSVQFYVWQWRVRQYLYLMLHFPLRWEPLRLLEILYTPTKYPPTSVSSL